MVFSKLANPTKQKPTENTRIPPSVPNILANIVGRIIKWPPSVRTIVPTANKKKYDVNGEVGINFVSNGKLTPITYYIKRSTPYTTLNEYFSMKNDQTSLNILKILAIVAAMVKNSSLPIVACPYAYELPIMKSPIRTEKKLMINISRNCLVFKSDSKDAWSIALK